MKISFVYPRFEKFLSENSEIDRGLVDYFLGDFTTPPSLGIPIMASWTPEDIDIELLDDNSGDKIDYSAPTDLVAINCFTPQATRAFEIADNFRAHGKKVIMGGFFPSFMVEECLKHADSVNVGEVEPTWLQIIEDLKNGELKPIYRGGGHFDLSKMKIPRRDIFYSKKNYTWEEDLIQLTRGCTYTCAMCAIPEHMGHRIRFRPIDDVIKELKTLKYENVYLADDTLFFPQRKMVDYATELFTRIAPLNKKYFVSSTMALKTDPKFLDLAAKAGVSNFYCTMNVDPISIRAIQGDKKAVQQLIDLVNMLNDRNIRFFGSFAIGRDWDDTSIADRCLELYTRAGIRTSEFFLFTPYPGSKQWDRLDKQERIFDKTWKHYNGAHLVADHPTMSRDELYGQFVKIWNEFFKMQKDQHAVELEPLTYQNGKESIGIPLRRGGVRNQAVITGMAALSPIGNELDEILDSLKNAKSGIDRITKFDTSNFRTDFGGEIKNFKPEEFLTEEELKQYDDDYLRYAVTVAQKAIKDSGTTVDSETALVLATCNGGLRSAEEEYSWKHGKSNKAFDEKMNLQAQYYGFGKAMATALGIKSEVWLVTTACSSSTGAIGLAQSLINRGYHKKIVIISSDAICAANMAGFNALKAISTERTAPFSIPSGLNIGEAAVAWVVEEMESAMLRRAVIHAKLAGHATTSDAYHPTTPDPRGDGVRRTLKGAMEKSSVSIDEIGCINTHGTGTDANDKAESKGIAKFIGDKNIPAISMKSFFGHCMGSTGLLEATGNILAMKNGFIPPTINFKEPRAGCTLDYVPNEPRKKEYDTFISANYAFGGNNAGVLISKWDKEIGSVKNDYKRVVITGASAVTSLGVGLKPLLGALRLKMRGISKAENIGMENLSSKMAGVVGNINTKKIDRRIDFSPLNPISTFATASAKLTLESANMKINRKNSKSVGIAMGVCNGPNEMGHMDAFFSDKTKGSDVNSFSNITANSTAGWVSNALMLKGVNITLSPGHHAGLEALAYAYDAVSDERANAVLASASDELYAQTMFNYDLMGYLYRGNEEIDYRFRNNNSKMKVLGEGSASLLLESLDSAKERGAEIWAEVLGYGMAMDDGMQFDTPSSEDIHGVIRACKTALRRAKIASEKIDAIVWAPQGNTQDKKVIDALDTLLGEKASSIPFFTTVFNTGYIESASILVSIAAFLEANRTGSYWPQMTGMESLDHRALPEKIEKVLVVASSDVGYNFATVLKCGE